MKKKVLLIFLFCIYFSSYSQANKELKEISFSELVSELTKDNDTIFFLKNTFVKFNKEEDKRYSLFEYRFKGKKYPTDTTHVYKTINFDNVHFEKNPSYNNYAFVNFRFHKPINLNDTFNFVIYNCQLDDGFTYINSGSTNTNDSNRLWFSDCTFNSRVIITDYAENQEFNLVKNHFNYLGTDDYSRVSVKPLLQISVSNALYFGFNTNKVNYDNETISIQIFNSKEAYILDNSIKSNVWNYLFIDNAQKLSFNNNTIESDLLFGIDKLKTEYEMQWPITDQNIIPAHFVFSNRNDYSTNDDFNSLVKNERVSNLSFYKNELSQLSKFHSYFSEFHDRQSANDVYIKIKNLETERLEYLYKEDKSFENYFELVVNQFLKRFSDYGTSPSKIVISSFNIILIFAFLFLFSTNSWNKINLNRYNKGIEQSINYFTSNATIIKAYEIDENKMLQIDKTKAALINNKNHVPKVFSFFSLFFINSQTKLIEFKLAFWNYLNVVKNSWHQLSLVKRTVYSFLLGVIILGYLLVKVLSIVFNALTLSINSFTTLGFGEIPIKGIGRYLAIIEGFIGWIFLTLFSVTLISQILS